MKYLNYEKTEKTIINIISKKDTNLVLNNLVKFLYNNFNKYNWIGIYFVREDSLILGPWKGKHPTEHTKIPIGIGICGSAAKSGKTEIVSDVKKDNRYLSCFISTQSEIVVPIIKNGEIIGEIDIDSDSINAFDNKDVKLLEKISKNKKFIDHIYNFDR